MAGEFERLFSPPPFGMRRADDAILLHDAAEQTVIDKIMTCVAAGMSVQEISSILKGKEAKDGR